MADRTIGLRIELNGVNGVITNINQLEEQINKAKQDLKGFDIGSAEFKKLTREISRAEGQLQDFNKAAEGISFEKKAEAIGKFTGGVTAGFAAATAAANLFGVDSEKVTLIAAQAQNLMTIALGARGIAEAITSAKTVQATIVEAFRTKAVQSETVALAELGVTEGVVAVETVALTAATAASAVGAGIATKAWQSLKAAMASSGIGLILVAVGALAGALLLMSDDTEKASDTLAKLDAQLKKMQETLDDTTRRSLNQLKIEQAQLEANGGSIEEITALKLKSYAIERDAAIKKVQMINAAQDEQLRVLKQSYIEGNLKKEEYEKQKTDIENKFGTERQQAIIARNNAEVNAEIEKINSLKAIRDRDQAIYFANRDLRLKLLNDGIDKELAALKLQYDKDIAAAKESGVSKKLIEDNYNKDRAKALGDYYKTLQEIVDKNETDLLRLKGNTYEAELIELQKAQSKEKVELEKHLTELEELNQISALGSLNIIMDLTEKQNLELQALRIKHETETLKSIQEIKDKADVDSLDEQLKVYNNEFELYKNAELAKLKYTAGLEATKRGLVLAEYTKFIEDAIAPYQKLFDKIQEVGQAEIKLRNEITKITKQTLLDTTTLEEQYYQRRLEIEAKYKDDGKKTQKQRLDDEKNLNRELLAEDLKYQADKLKLEVDAAQKRYELILKDPTQSPQALKAAHVELLKLQEQYANAVKGITANTTKNGEDKTKELYDNISKALQQFQQTLSSIASLTAQAFSFQLERLQYNYEQTLALVVGDTEEANAKRVELEKIYQTEKRAIEKKAQLTSLKFSLAQAIASGAQAIVTALATLGPIAGPILAVVNGAITAAQIAVIGQQIAFVESQPLRRGGKLAGGGFVSGPSHEQGGVYAGGGFTLEGNESVINRNSTLKYGPLLSAINEQGGGRPIMVNSIMDSRLAEVLATQKSEPIRAYVLESEITKSQAINKRLDDLASY